MRLLLLIVALYFFGFAYADSNPPSSSPFIAGQDKESHTGHTNKKTASEQIGTDKVPFVIKSIEGEKTADRLKQDRPYEDEHSANEGRLITWTVILGIATCCLVIVGVGQIYMFWRQLRLMREAIKDGTKVANAAKTQADALINSERARIFIGVFFNDDLIAATLPTKNTIEYQCCPK